MMSNQNMQKLLCQRIKRKINSVTISILSYQVIVKRKKNK